MNLTVPVEAAFQPNGRRKVRSWSTRDKRSTASPTKSDSNAGIKKNKDVARARNSHNCELLTREDIMSYSRHSRYACSKPSFASPRPALAL